MTLATSSIGAVLADALAHQYPGIGLRVESSDDLPFLSALYTGVRWQELSPADWPEAAKREFLDQQCRLQHAHYLQHYAGAEMLLITAAAPMLSAHAEATLDWPDPQSSERQLIGRIYLRRGATEIRLMDIALLPCWQGKGIGQCLITSLQQSGRVHAVDITLHVEPTNPAQRLYQRLGFALIEQRGVYDFLGWQPVASNEIVGAREA